MSDEINDETMKTQLGSKGSPLTTLSGQNVKKLEHRWVMIEHGSNEEGDYIWHFSQLRKERPFPDDLDIFWRIIATHLSKVIPEQIKVVMCKPPGDWDIKVMSVIAKGIAKKWSFDEDDMSKHLEPICDHMSDNIDKANPRRTSL